MKVGIIPYQKSTDFEYDDNEKTSRPKLPSFHKTHDIDTRETKLQFWKPEDIPLNRRYFMYRPCAANPSFKELGYCCTEYPYSTTGMNLMDRSSGISVLKNANHVVSVSKEKGWRSSRCDVGIKGGACYWEVEIMQGGLTENGDKASLSLQKKKDLNNNIPHLRLGISRRESNLEAPVGCDSYSYGIRDISLESIHAGKVNQVIQPSSSLKAGDRVGILLRLPSVEEQIQQADEYTERRVKALVQNTIGTSVVEPSKKRAKLTSSQRDFQRALLETIDQKNIIRDHIPIRYKNQLFFESTDYVKTTKPEYYSSDTREREEYYHLEGSRMSIYLNGKYMGDPFCDLKPFLPPFSELQYNEKFYFGYWKHGGALNANQTDASTYKKGLLLRNKYVNNNKLGYYPTVSCFKGGTAAIITNRGNLKYFDQVIQEPNEEIKTLDILFMEQIAEDIVWDIIDEIEEEKKAGTLQSL